MADQRLPDEEIQLRQKARQRLIGAVTLMMAAVVVLPWALDGKPKVHANEIAVYLPASVPSHSDNALAAPATAPAPVASSEPDAAPVAPVNTAPVAAAHEAVPLAQPAPVIQAHPITVTEPPVFAKAGPARSTRPHPSAASPATDPARPEHARPAHDAAKLARAESSQATAGRQSPERSADEAAPPVRAAADAPKAMQGGYVLQVGTFAQADNARELKARLTAKGVPAFTERLASSSGDRVRVRVGPYPSREAAEQALSQVNALGLSGVVLNVH